MRIKLTDLRVCYFVRWTRPDAPDQPIPDTRSRRTTWPYAEGLFVWDHRSYAVYLPFANAPQNAIDRWGGPWPATGTGLSDLSLSSSVGNSRPGDPKGERHWRIADGILEDI